MNPLGIACRPQEGLCSLYLGSRETTVSCFHFDGDEVAGACWPWQHEAV